MVFAHLLNATHHVARYAEETAAGKWTASPDFCYWNEPLTELSGKTMGIVGFGNIGAAVARIALAFGMNVAAVTSKSPDKLPAGVKAVALDKMLSTADVVSLHCPLTDSTRHMINPATLAKNETIGNSHQHRPRGRLSTKLPWPKRSTKA